MRFALKQLKPARTPDEPEVLDVELGGTRHAVPVRRSKRARRMTLKIDSRLGGPVLTLPRRFSVTEARRFLARHAGWLESRMDQLPAPVPFVDGGIFPLRGEPVRILHRPGRGTVSVMADGPEPVVSVHGGAEHLARRLTDWLKDEARCDLTRSVERHAATLGVSPSAIRVRDTGTRWGSCSSRRTLSFSWRLVLAPPSVLDYLAAHEVAHLKHMNHGPKFWKLVALLDPDYREAEDWLKRDGPTLFAVGRGAGDAKETPAA
ncbi:MAG TPA: SprT family zinc-dependent metalloprotease [Afifellaceae bacterium]|nr:SprT family zinc-dependent metalloprotease [Afifellaceae bacterium]